MENNNFAMLALVAIVAVVGVISLVMLVTFNVQIISENDVLDGNLAGNAVGTGDMDDCYAACFASFEAHYDACLIEYDPSYCSMWLRDAAKICLTECSSLTSNSNTLFNDDAVSTSTVVVRNR